MKKFFRLLRYDLPLHFVLLLTNWLPDNVPFLRLRGFLASFFLGSCGKNLRLGRNISFYNPAVISIGENVYIAHGCWFMGGARIEIQNDVLFGPYCVVVSSTHTRINNSYRYGKTVQEPIEIKRGSWLSAQVTVTGGSSVGKGTLVAAGAVVSGVLPDNILAGGLPARIIREIGKDE